MPDTPNEAAIAVANQLHDEREKAADEPVDTESEFKSLWTDATEGAARFAALAKAAEKAHPEIAKVYEEIGGTIMSLLVDLTAATGGALMNVEDEIDRLPAGGGGPEASSLLAEDAEKYLQLFAQYVRLFEGLEGVVPPGEDGDKQREVFATLRRMTEGMMEFTKSITISEEDDDDDDDDDDDEGDDDE